MKYIKSCAAALLALAAVQAASAQTTIRVTGSTAFRSATIAGIKSLLGSTYDEVYQVSSSSTTGSTNSNYTTFVGTYSGNSVIIQCAWTGSAEGIRDVAQGLNQKFIKSSYVVNNTAGTIETASTTSASSDTSVFESGIPEIAMADNTQAATIFKTPALTQTAVGIIPFVFVKGQVVAGHPSKTAFDSVTNITSQMAKAVYAGGAPLSFFTGATADASTYIYGLGRNPFSGTRIVTFAETGIGSTSTATQFTPTTTSTNITGMSLTVADATNGFLSGNNGYSSGGTLVGDLYKPVSDTDGSGNLQDGAPFGLIGYVGVSDAATMLKSINAGSGTDTSAVLSYNGVRLVPTYSSSGQSTTWDYTPLKEGKYSFWSVAYLSYRKSSGANGTTAISGLPKTFADGLATYIIGNVPSSSGVKLADMKVTRTTEGGSISLK